MPCLWDPGESCLSWEASWGWPAGRRSCLSEGGRISDFYSQLLAFPAFSFLCDQCVVGNSEGSKLHIRAAADFAERADVRSLWQWLLWCSLVLWGWWDNHAGGFLHLKWIRVWADLVVLWAVLGFCVCTCLYTCRNTQIVLLLVCMCLLCLQNFYYLFASSVFKVCVNFLQHCQFFGQWNRAIWCLHFNLSLAGLSPNSIFYRNTELILSSFAAIVRGPVWGRDQTYPLVTI